MEILDGQNDLCWIKFSSKSYKAYCSSDNLCFFERRPKSSPPGQYSKAKNSFF
jgi:hypothetical protein